jgi:phosphoglycerol transferase MdoB-like AlkP superfamily enzyme
MHLGIKNIIKIGAFIPLLLSPFWIVRLLLLLSIKELTIENPVNYLFYTMRFDLKAMVIWYAPLFFILGIGLFLRHKWWENVSRFIFLLLYLSALIFGLISVFYYPISKTIVGVEIFQMISGQSYLIIFGYMAEYWWGILLAISVLFAVRFLDKKLKIELTTKSALVFCFISLVFLGLIARGSFKLKPLNLLDAYSALESQEAVSAVTPIYILIESIGKSEIEYTAYISDSALQIELAKDVLVYNKLAYQKPNICIILLESFGKEYTSLNDANRPSYTPFLDSMMSVSMNFTNAYANGLRSMDAVASIYTGIPCLMKQPFIGSLYTQSNIESIPEALSKEGYFCSFYHAADELSMGFKPFLLANGLDQYMAQQEYPNEDDFDGKWGIFDEPFLQFFENKLSNQQQPWCSGIFTISSHHPYTVPSQHHDLPKGTSEIHQAIGYTDRSLRAFFESARTEKWFENTIFIITADHTSINETYEHQGYRSKYGVPLLIYSKLMPAGINDDVKQHVDIFPTVKQLAGISKQVAMGRSLLDEKSQSAIHYDGTLYTYTNDSFCLQWDGTSNYKLFAYKKDKVDASDLASIHHREGDQMLHELKVGLQKYNYRLLNNKFH